MSASRDEIPSMFELRKFYLWIGVCEASMVNRQDGLFRRSGTNNSTVIGKKGENNPIKFLKRIPNLQGDGTAGAIDHELTHVT